MPRYSHDLESLEKGDMTALAAQGDILYPDPWAWYTNIV